MLNEETVQSLSEMNPAWNIRLDESGDVIITSYYQAFMMTELIDLMKLAQTKKHCFYIEAKNQNAIIVLYDPILRAKQHFGIHNKACEKQSG